MAMRRSKAMKTRLILIAGGVAGLSAAVLTMPIRSVNAATHENQEAGTRVRVERLPKVVELQKVQIDDEPLFVEEDEPSVLEEGLSQGKQVIDPDIQQITIFDGDEGPSWLGVEAREVTPENAKDLKLPAERGVLIGAVTPDSPAAKAGLKEKDVITEVNGQRVEGAAQFRRIVREIPAGRAV